MISKAATTSTIVTGAGMPIRVPTPDRPDNSLSTAPMQDKTSVATENHAQYLPKCC